MQALNGLKKAPCCWFAKLSTTLINYGFKQSHANYSLFSFHHDDARLHVLVYVDDLIISTNDHVPVQQLRHISANVFA